MKKLILCLCTIAALGACKEETKTEAQEKPTIKIGATLPLTGPFSETAHSAKEAILMALEKWESKNTKYNYELFIEDDSSQPQKAVLNVHNFISTKNINAVMSLFGIVDRPVDEIANQNKIISLSCSYGKTEVPEYGINNCVQNKEVAETLIPKLKKENIKKIALVMANTNVSLAVGDYFADLLPKEGFEIVAYEKYNMDTRDMRISILKMEERKPDYYLTFATHPLTDIFVKQLKETTGKLNVSSFGSFAEMDPQLFHMVEGLWTIDTIAGTEEFESEFTSQTHRNLKGCTANLYDNLDMLIWAFENTPPKKGQIIPDNIDVIETIKKIKNWDGATGIIEFKNGIASPKAKLKMYNNGKWETIED